MNEKRSSDSTERHQVPPNESSERDDQSSPHLHVDEDWKSAVEREKQELREQMEQQHSDLGDLPPASMQMLVSQLATQVMAALGHLPDPQTGQPQISKPLARHLIDTLDLLEQKTRGNLDAGEAKFLSDTLHQLRMVFLSTSDSPGGESSSGSSSIELP